MEDSKRAYQSPQVEVFGTVEQITETHTTNKGGVGIDNDVKNLQHSGSL